MLRRNAFDSAPWVTTIHADLPCPCAGTCRDCDGTRVQEREVEVEVDVTTDADGADVEAVALSLATLPLNAVHNGVRQPDPLAELPVAWTEEIAERVAVAIAQDFVRVTQPRRYGLPSVNVIHPAREVTP